VAASRNPGYLYIYVPVPTLEAQVSGAEDPAAVSKISFSPNSQILGYIHTYIPWIQGGV
jgi:hypothetical protein